MSTLTGTYASRPTATTVAAETIYVATDVAEMYLSDGSVWSVIGSGGNELGYAEVTTLTNNTSSTRIDVPGLTTTFMVGERPINIHVTARLAMTLNNEIATAHIVLDGVVVSRIERAANTVQWGTHSGFKRISGLTPGSIHTAKVMLSVMNGAGVGTARIAGDATNPCNIQVVTV